MHELRGERELGLREAIERLSACDLVLVEGYKRARIPKLEIWRPSVGKPLLHPGDPDILAVATDVPGDLPAGIRVFGLNDVAGIATFVGECAAAWPPTD